MFVMRYYHTVLLQVTHPMVYMGTSTHLDGFIIGAFVALKSESRFKSYKIPFQLLIGILVLCLYFLFPNPLTQVSVSNIFIYFFIAFGFGIILDSVLISRSGRLNKILENPILRYLGKISYGLYIFHLPVFIFLPQVLKILNIEPDKTYQQYFLQVFLHFIITLFLSITSYSLLEKPFLKLKNRFSKLITRPI